MTVKIISKWVIMFSFRAILSLKEKLEACQFWQKHENEAW